MSESDVTPEALNPQPPMWPECGACRTPYVLRRVLTLSNGGEFRWLWVQDCKRTQCKKAKPVVGGEALSPEGQAAMEAPDAKENG